MTATTKNILVFPGVTRPQLQGNKVNIFLTDDIEKIGSHILTFPVKQIIQHGFTQLVDFDTIIFPKEYIKKPFRYAIISDERYPIWIVDFKEFLDPNYDVIILEKSDRLQIADVCPV